MIQYFVVSVMLVFMLGMGASAVAALYWAARDGQFHNMKDGARVIFDETETVGEITDGFPGESPEARPGAGFWLAYGTPVALILLVFSASILVAVVAKPAKGPAEAGAPAPAAVSAATTD